MELFINPHFVIIHKQAGFLSVPSRQGAMDSRPCCGKLLEENLNERIFPVHRLDECVSGLLLFARTAQAQRVASAWFEHHTVQKHYEALSEISPETLTKLQNPAFTLPLSFEWKSKILRGKKRAYMSPHGKDTHTHATLSSVEQDYCRWDLYPVTGRSHQLRFELSTHGFPILGDDLYGAVPHKHWKQKEIALRLVSLDFKNCDKAQELGLPLLIETVKLSVK